jgi:hypothetical protein
MSTAKQKFPGEVSSAVLAEVGALAQREGRQLHALVEEALTDLIEKRKNAQPRAHVMQAYGASHGKYAELYQKLAK